MFNCLSSLISGTTVKLKKSFFNSSLIQEVNHKLLISSHTEFYSILLFILVLFDIKYKTTTNKQIFDSILYPFSNPLQDSSVPVMCMCILDLKAV